MIARYKHAYRHSHECFLDVYFLSKRFKRPIWQLMIAYTSPYGLSTVICTQGHSTMRHLSFNCVTMKLFCCASVYLVLYLVFSMHLIFPEIRMPKCHPHTSKNELLTRSASAWMHHANNKIAPKFEYYANFGKQLLL